MFFFVCFLIHYKPIRRCIFNQFTQITNFPEQPVHELRIVHHSLMYQYLVSQVHQRHYFFLQKLEIHTSIPCQSIHALRLLWQPL